jgi:glycine/D-amino acid oxidase-like deaminating enzyme
MRLITGADYYVGTFTPGAAILQPAAQVRGLATHLSTSMDIFENSPAVRMDQGSMHVVTTPDGKMSAPRLILANNGHLESLGYFKRRLMRVFAYASMTRQMTDQEVRVLGGEAEWALIPADPMGTTVRRIKEGRIVVRNTFTYNPDLQTSLAQIARIGRTHDRSFAARFPMLKGVTKEHRWGGHLCLSLNSVSAFGEVGDRVYAAGCCNGLGTVKSTLAGTLAAELACGVKSELLDNQLAEPAPQRLYLELIMAVGVPAKLCWLQHRARADL